MRSIFKIIFLLCSLSFVGLYAAVVDYQSLYQEEQETFRSEMQEAIKKAASSVSVGVRELYEGIDYHSVWVDKSYLTHYAELLAHELKSDFDKGLHQELVE